MRTIQITTREKDNDGYANLLSAGYDIVSLPTLEELIDACGNELEVITRDALARSTQSKGMIYNSFPHTVPGEHDVSGIRESKKLPHHPFVDSTTTK